MKNLTVNQIKKACSLYPYIAIRFEGSNNLIGINSKVAFISKWKNKPNVETQFISYRPITFNEYINIKKPFV